MANEHHHHQHMDGENQVTPTIFYEAGALKIELKNEQQAPPELEMTHEKWMHLIIVSKDLTVYRHMHPEQLADGIFNIQLNLPEDEYRVFIDINPKHLVYKPEPITLKVGAGGNENSALSTDTNFTKTVEGYTVELKTNDFPVQEDIYLDFDLKENVPEYYLGALGHLIIINETADRFIHVHPVANDEVKFIAHFDTPGTYKMWAEFQFDSKVTVYSFVIDVK